MGNHRFKLSDMMPNAWFYKLRDMSKVGSHSKSMQSSRKSFYYASASDSTTKLRALSPTNTKFCDSRFPAPMPKRPKRKTVYMPSPIKIAPTSPPHMDFSSESDQSSDFIIHVDDTDSITEFSMISEPHLPPIHTKPGKQSALFHPIKPRRSRRSSTSRKSFKVGRKCRRRRNADEERKTTGLFYSESFAIVKASFDPEKDFKESMMEMIVENNIRASKDLEELLACYLSLNSNQYHDTIIKVFEQIWAQLHF